ncbi:glycosyltransferase family 2 protein, partial [Streptomyces sp. NPDC059233]
YLAVGGMPRRPSPTDRLFLNAVRRHTDRISHCRAMVVENSTRRLRAYGVAGTARWYLDQGSGRHGTDPR